MKGKILDYSIQKSSGLISGNDENRYIFSSSGWRSDKSPEVNQIVDFDIEGKEAKDIYLETGTMNTKTSDSIWMAITSLIFGILSFLTLFGMESWDKDTELGLFIFVSAGLTLGILTLRNKQNGKNMAIAGIVLSAIALVALLGSVG